MLSENTKLKYFFEPSVVAVVGASRNPSKPGHVILSNFLENKKRGLFKGKVYPINPNADEILGVKCYSSLLDLPEKPNLCIIVVPAAVVPKVLEDAGKIDCPAAVIISAGFSEVGNKELENKVLDIAKKYGIRIIGPNCLGILNMYTGVDTLFLPPNKPIEPGVEVEAAPRPPQGFVSFLTQSGAFGVSSLDYFSGEGIGIRIFVSYGNRIDVDDADLLAYLADDEKTRAIMLYIESLKNGRKFMEIASQVTLKKPIVAFKAGRTRAGAKAALSHTASLAGRDEIYDAAFKQCGIIRAYTMNEFFIIGKALVSQPPAKGPNVAIVTDGGGAGVMAADACELRGLKVGELGKDTKELFEKYKDEGVFPKFAVTNNPIDLTGSATTDMYIKAIEAVLKDPLVDSVIVLALHHVPGIQYLKSFVHEIADVVRKVNKDKKPVVVADIGSSEGARYIREEFDKDYIPSYSSPEDAAVAIAALTRYGKYLAKKGVFEKHLSEWKPIY